MRVYLITLKRSAASYHLYSRFHGFCVVAPDDHAARRLVIRYMRDRGYVGSDYRAHRMEFQRDTWSTCRYLGPAARGVTEGVKLEDNTGEPRARTTTPENQ